MLPVRSRYSMPERAPGGRRRRQQWQGCMWRAAGCRSALWLASTFHQAPTGAGETALQSPSTCEAMVEPKEDPVLRTWRAQRGTGASAIDGVLMVSRTRVKWEPSDPTKAQPSQIDISMIQSERMVA